MKLLMTGGSGRLGSELWPLLQDAGMTVVAPPSELVDVRDARAVRGALEQHRPDAVLHAAAWTDVGGAEEQREACWRVNVEGTRNVAHACREAGARLVHVSTDYVFWGDRGGYREDEPPGPTRNYYALSKLAAEEAARAEPRALILRTSFRPREWPYPVAFEDLFTSQDYVDVIAPEIAMALTHLDRIPFDLLHVATERKSVLELARRRAPEVRAGSRADASVALPEDISLDTGRWKAWKAEFASKVLR